MVVYTLEQRQEILQQIDLQNMPILGKKIMFSDEAHFDLGGYVNKQNCRIWGTKNPHAYIEKSTHPKRVTVWCGFWSRGIIGPFFENEQGEAVTYILKSTPNDRFLRDFSQHNFICSQSFG